MMNVPKLPPLSDAALLEIVARASQNVAAQTNARQQFSNLGPKFSSIEKNVMYRQLMLQDGMGGMGGQRGGMLEQTRLRSSTSQGNNRSSMMGYSAPSRMMGIGMPTNHRRATFDVPHPSMMSTLGAMPRNRRATLDMPPSSMISGLGAMPRNRRATLDMPTPPSSLLMDNVNAMPNRKNMSPPFAAGFLQDCQHQGYQQQAPQRMQSQAINKANRAPSDAEVRSATQDIVSAAIDVLRPAGARRVTVDRPLPGMGSDNGGTSRLDAMTDLFLERSRARLSSRPVSLMGPRRSSLATSVGAEVETQTKACLSAAVQNSGVYRQHHMHRKVSILGNM